MQTQMVTAARLLLSSPVAKEVFRFEHNLIVVIDSRGWAAYGRRRRKLQTPDPLERLVQVLATLQIGFSQFRESSLLPSGVHVQVYLVPMAWRNWGHPVDRPPYGLPRGAIHLATRFDPSQLDFVAAPTPQTQRAAQALFRLSGSRRSQLSIRAGRHR